MVTEVEFDEDGTVVLCLLEAVLTKREFAIEWHNLKDSHLWHAGWK